MFRRTAPLLLVVLLGCHRVPAPAPEVAPPPRPVAPGLDGGTAYLLMHQSADGAWRSDVYATFKDGTALTPLVLCSLQDAADFGDTTTARRKASEWLAKRVKADGTIDEGPDGLPYPVYTAALSVTALSHPENKDLQKQRDAWLKYLLDRQLTEQNGWSPEDKQYGGWGYYPGIPKKPRPGEAVPAQQLLETNISATAFAVEAIRASGERKTSLWFHLQMVIRRLQNEDGGFRLVVDDPVRNKGGMTTDPDGKPRFNSYGSATADGARIAFLALIIHNQDPNVNWPKQEKGGPIPPPGPSLPLDGGRSLEWLKEHFRADAHPGTYIPAHEPNRNAVYFYYARSVAKLFFGMLGWREYSPRLEQDLLARQLPDGSWSNPVDQQRENDPVLATAYAVSALAECRKAQMKK